jgi:hypothetical protein
MENEQVQSLWNEKVTTETTAEELVAILTEYFTTEGIIGEVINTSGSLSFTYKDSNDELQTLTNE